MWINIRPKPIHRLVHRAFGCPAFASKERPDFSIFFRLYRGGKPRCAGQEIFIKQYPQRDHDMSQEAEQSTNNPTTVHLLSDRSGGTLDMLWQVIKERFPKNGFTLKKYHMADGASHLSEEELEQFLTDIINTPGKNVVYMTVESPERAELIKAAMERVKIACTDPLEAAVTALANVSGQTPVPHSAIDAGESARIRSRLDAMQFSQRCDDGNEIEEAFARGSIFLVAGSRVGKTGTCAILALDGHKVGNQPYSVEIADYVGDKLKQMMALHPNVPVVALVKDAGELSANRRARMKLQLANGTPEMWRQSEENYFGLPAVTRELRAFDRFCKDVGITMIVDTTRCQPEEAAARVLQKLKERTPVAGS